VTQYVTQATQQRAMPHYAIMHDRNNHLLSWSDLIGCVNTDVCKNEQEYFFFISARPHIRK